MINFCCDTLYYNLDINWLEEDWAYIYKVSKKKEWPELKLFSEFAKQNENFKKECFKLGLDPESQKRRQDLRLLPYPTCTRHHGIYNEESWGEFSSTYPHTEQVRFIDYCYDEGVDHKLWQVEVAPVGSFYVIGLNIFHHDFDYFSEISTSAFKRLKAEEINILFFYDEADCPLEIKKSLLNLCKKHNINEDNIYFISNNVYADRIKNFYYFFDDELLYRRSQDSYNIVQYHENNREKNFTALVRIHRIWRSFFMSNIWLRGLHRKGYFSYNYIFESDSKNGIGPFQENLLKDNKNLIQNFLDSAPFKADSMPDTEHNGFNFSCRDHYENSYCNFVVETYFANPDNTHGRGITEKILKPICHNQFFIVIGPPHTLKYLRKLGYKTFNRCIDESYDEIEDNEKRMNAVIELCSSIADMSINEIHDLYLKLKPEIVHNSELFNSSKKRRLTDLIDKLNNEN